jgi:hypothetical protein
VNQDEYNALAARHGGEAGKTPLDPTIDNPDPSDARINPKIPNPNPTYRYVFKDGTYVEARDTLKGQNGQVDLEVTNPGTALKVDDTNKPTSVSAPSTEKYIVTRQPDGTLKASDNPNYKGDGKDPTSSVTSFGDQLIGVYDDGKGNLTTKVLLTKDPTQTLQAVTLPDGSMGSFDPKTGAVSVIAKADPKNPGTPVKGGDGKFYIWDPKANGGLGGMVDSGMPAAAASVVGTGPDDEFTYALDGQGNEIAGTRRPNPNYKKPAVSTVGTDANSEWIYAIDKDGNEVPGSRRKNPNYVAPKPTELAADTVSAVRGLLQPDGTVKWIKNDQQLTVSQAMADLMNQAGMKVTAGSMSMDDAKNMLTGAVNLMNAQTARQTANTADVTAQGNLATGALTAANNAAQTGGNLLQNRVTAATGTLQSLATAPMGHMLNAPPSGTGAALVGGLQDWITDLGGGQGVYDAAAHMVQQADPTNQSGVAAPAYATIRSLMDQYKAQTGRDWTPPGSPDRQFTSPTTATDTTPMAPTQTNVNVQQNLAAQQALAAQAAGTAGQPTTTSLNAQGLLDNPQGRAIAAGQTPVAAQGAPTTPGLYNPAYQQGMLSSVGQPANLAASPMLATGPYQPLPFIGPWRAPVTV